MKYSASLLAFAASAAATFPFHNAPAFTCPQNTDNKCTDQQKTGFAFDDLSTGPFSQYKDFNFNGWTSGAGFGGRFGKRTNKGISGVCGSDKSKAPSFGAGDKFSLGSIHVTPEFDCDLEFHYDMPDGSTCKHRNQCTKGGTNVVNKQCGGATNVTIIYPPQPEKPKPSCSVIISTISFDCSTKQSTVPPKTKTKTTKTKTTKGASTTSAAATSSVPSVPAETTTSSAAPVASSSAPAESVPGSQTSSAPAEITSAPAESVPVESSPAESSASSAPVESAPVESAPVSSAPVSSAPVSSAPVSSAPAESAPVESAPAESVPILTTSAPISEVVSAPPVTSTIVTSFDSTSTIFVTEIQTITSCAPTVTNCPANHVTTTVVTIATSTTVCPVTQTLTTVISATSSAAPVASSEGPSEIVISTSIGDIISAPAGSTSSAAAVESSAAASSAAASSAAASSAVASSAVASSAVASSAVVSSAVESSTGVVVPTSAGSVASSSAAAVDTTSSAAPVSTAPVEPLPCPGVVPSCLNTFLFETGCTDNSDAACYCPNALFVKNVYECIYAHGESESIISEAITFFQGICAPYVNTNPGIATGVPTYVTSIAAPTSVAPVFTTITVDITTVVPCTDEAGSTIPSSSTTVVVDTTMTVPQIHFTSTTDDVAIVPAPTGVPLVTETEAVPVVSATATKTGAVGVSTSAAAPVNSAPAVTSAPAVPIGTAVGTGGLVRPSSSVISPPIVTAGSGRVNAGLGLAVAAVLGALAL